MQNGNTEEVNIKRSAIDLGHIEDQIYKSGWMFKDQMYKSDKTFEDYLKYPPTKIIKAHRKDLRRIWKKGKP